jgi:hypothetical protein
MRIAKSKGTDILKRTIVPLTACLLVLAFLPSRKFGRIDVEVITLAVLMATIEVFVVFYLWKKLKRNNSN